MGKTLNGNVTPTASNPTSTFIQLFGVSPVLSQISILGAKSENRVSEIQWLTDPQTLEKANLRQNQEEFTDFILKLEWRAPGILNNSGVYVRLPNGRLSSFGAALTSGYEIQIDNTGERPGDASSFPQAFNNPFHQTGAVYPVHTSLSFPNPNGKPTTGTIPTRSFGEWNAFEITVQANRIRVVLNGQPTLAGGDYEDQNSTYPRGHIALQNHFKGFGVQFRRVRIKTV